MRPPFKFSWPCFYTSCGKLAFSASEKFVFSRGRGIRQSAHSWRTPRGVSVTHRSRFRGSLLVHKIIQCLPVLTNSLDEFYKFQMHRVNRVCLERLWSVMRGMENHLRRHSCRRFNSYGYLDRAYRRNVLKRVRRSQYPFSVFRGGKSFRVLLESPPYRMTDHMCSFTSVTAPAKRVLLLPVKPCISTWRQGGGAGKERQAEHAPMESVNP